jgi:acetoin utilization protein AcuB
VEVEKWMKRQVRTVKPLDSIQRAREIMASQRINQLPVVVDGKLVGIVTDRDLRDAFPSVFESEPRGRGREIPPNADPKHITVEMVMTPNVLTLGPESPISEAARLMRRERVGAIPVIQDGHLVGILTRSDVLDAFIELAED